MGEVTQRTKAIKAEKNSLQVSAAYQAQLFFNANRSEGVNPVESYTDFLPYPQLSEHTRGFFSSLNVNEAREVLNAWETLPFICQQALGEYKRTLIAIIND